MVDRLVVNRGSAPITPQPPFTPVQSFVQRKIELSITLQPDQQTGQPNTFANTGSDTITLSDFRTSVRISNNGSPGGSDVEVRIYGLAEETMNELSALGIVFNRIQKNSILISAGDDIAGMTAVFGGTIFTAMPDYNQAPNVPFIMQCFSGYVSGVVPVPASSFPQPTDVATIMAGFAAQLNPPVGFENNGITTQLPASYFSGTITDQIKKCATAAHINAELVDANTKLAIWPIGGSRTSLQDQNIPLISKDTGMIGYPTLSPNGYMMLKTLFNPLITFGGRVKVQSARVPLANRVWTVQQLDLALDALIPKGQWMASCHCFPVDLPAPPLGGS
ncbi:baseplate hub protein [Bradyrhizobium sp.]